MPRSFYNIIVVRRACLFSLTATYKENKVKSKIILFLSTIAIMCLSQFEIHSQTKTALTKIEDSTSVLPADSLRYGMVYISHIAPDHVSVLDPETNRVVRKIKSGMGACCVELSSQLDHGYIANYKSNDITVFDTKTGNTIATVPAGDHPSHLVLTADARYLLIGHESNDGLWFLDTRSNEIVKKLGDGTGILCRPEKGKKIYQSQIFTPFVYVIDPETQTVEKRIQVGGRPLDLAFSPDQRYIYVANYDLNEVEKICTKCDSVVARIHEVNNARGIGVTTDGKFAFVTNVQLSTVTVIDLASAAIVKTIPVGTMPTSIAMGADGRYAYVACQGNASVFVIDTKTQEIVQSVVVDSNPITVQVR